MKLCLGVGPDPIHPQHLEVMTDLSEWMLIDLHVPGRTNWDAIALPIPDECCGHIYASHLLEHFPHNQLEEILRDWHSKLKLGGKLTLNVPDLLWALKVIQRFDQGALLTGYYNQWYGEHGLLSVIYGNQLHEGEYHKSGFTERSLRELLERVGFTQITVTQLEDAHDMGVLIAEAIRE